jgi:hypothetical protein
MKSTYTFANKLVDLSKMITSFKESAAKPLEIIEHGSGEFEHPGDDIKELSNFSTLTDDQLKDLHSDLGDGNNTGYEYIGEKGESRISVRDLKSELPKIKSVAEEILGTDNGQTWAVEQGNKLTKSLTETFLPIIIKAYNFAKNLAA